MATLLQTQYTVFRRSGTSTNTASGDARGLIEVYLESQSAASNSSLIKIVHKINLQRDSAGSQFDFNTSSSYRANNGSYGGTYQNVGPYPGSGVNEAWSGSVLEITRTIGTTYHTVYHNSDGSGRVYVNGSITLNTFRQLSTGLNFTGSMSSQFNVALPTIDRTSILTSPTNYFNWTVGNDIYIGFNAKSSSLTENIIFRVNGVDAVIRYDISEGYIVFSEAEKNALYAAMPNNNGTAEIILNTYSGATYIGTSIAYIYVNITDANPIFTTYTHEDVDTAILTLTGNNQKYVSGYSDIKVTITSGNKAVAQKGATMVNYIVKCGTQQTTVAFSSGSTVTATLSNITASTIEVFAVDSRGNQTAKNYALTWVPYTQLIIGTTTFARVDYITEGVTLVANGTYYAVNFGSQTNALTATYQYKETSSGTWINGTSTITVTPSGNNWSINQTLVGDVAGGFDPTKSFDIRVTVADKIASKVDNDVITKGTPVLHLANGGVGVGKVWERGKLDVNGSIVSTTATSISSSNLNNLVGTGWFYGNTLTNAPSDGVTDWWYIEQTVYNSDYAHQTAYPLSGTSTLNTTWVRDKRAGVWSSWKNTTEHDTGWLTPTFQNSWVNYDGGFATAQYRKIGKKVILKGLVKSGTINNAIFTLPTGYRPAATNIYSVNSNGAFGSVYVASSGTVTPVVGNNGFVSLSGIEFFVD